MSVTLQPYPITDNSDFRAWALDHPKAFALLREIIFRWRASNIKKRGYLGPWSVYPRERWAEWSGLSVPQVKRELHRLETDGLLRRVRGRFQGSTVRTYLQPTMLALEHAGKASDRARLGPTDAPMEAPVAKPIAAPVTAPVDAPVGEPTDYTSLPSSPTEAMKTTSTKKVHPHPKGKGKAGDDVNEMTAGKNTEKIDDLDEDAAFELEQSQWLEKKAKLYEAKFPRLTGKHEVKVKYPADLYGPRWFGFSLELKLRLYQRYQSYVQNFYDAQKAGSFAGSAKTQGAADWSNWSDDDDAALEAAAAKKKVIAHPTT